jgi:AcrR family transcriptional regulator
MNAATATSITQPALRPGNSTPANADSVVPLRRDAYGRLVALPRRERARRGEGDRLREEILEAAEYLLARYGHDDAVSIRAVANRVGCTPPAIYIHFADKTELLFEVCARRFGAMQSEIDAAVAAHTDPFDRLVSGSKAYIRFGLENPERYSLPSSGKTFASQAHRVSITSPIGCKRPRTAAASRATLVKSQLACGSSVTGSCRS